MSLEKYNQIISNSSEVEVTYLDSKIETYHRLAYLYCVNDENDIYDIDKIFHFISENYAFFSQLTENKQLSNWIYQHVFQLANSTSEIDYPDSLTIDDYKEMIIKDFGQYDIDYHTLSNVLFSIPQYITNIVEDLNMNIISEQCLSNIRGLKKLSQNYLMKDLYDACCDLEVYIQYFDDIDEIIRLFQVVDIQAYKVLQFIERLEK